MKFRRKIFQTETSSLYGTVVFDEVEIFTSEDKSPSDTLFKQILAD